MKKFFSSLCFLCALLLNAFGQYDTNNLSNPLVDENGLFGWPTNPTVHSITGTNYTGLNWSITLAGANPITYTNFATGASYMLFPNAHFRILDQYKTTWSTGTNGVLSILQSNGCAVVISNGTITLSSNGIVNGIINAGKIIASIDATNVSALTNYHTLPAWISSSNLFESQFSWNSNAFVFGTNWLFTNLNADINFASNNILTNMQAFTLNASNVLLTAIGTAAFNTGSTSNALQTQITVNSNAMITISNELVVASNALNSKILVPTTKALNCTLTSTFSSAGVAFSAPLMPDANYCVTLYPQDQNTAQYPIVWVDTLTTSGFTIRIPVQTNYNLNFYAIIVERTQ